MAEGLENSLDELFGDGGVFEDEALAGEKKLSRADAAADWLEPDAVALSPDDPPVVAAAAAGAAPPPALHDPSEVALDPADAPPLELAQERGRT